MDKKGFLLAEETLKIIVAVVCLGFLIYFLSALYFSNANSKEKINAEETISRISDVVKNNQINLEPVEMLNPAGWHLLSFVDVQKPNVCTGKNCLCICSKSIFSKNQLAKCDKNGACLIIDNLQSFGEIKIEKSGATSIEIDKTNGVVVRLK